MEDCIGEAEHSVGKSAHVRGTGGGGGGGEREPNYIFVNSDGRVVEAKRAIPREDAPNQPVSPQVKKVFLGGLSLETSEDDVKEIFEAMGVVSKPL